MSTFVKRGQPHRKSIGAALFVGAAWAVLMGTLWFFFRDGGPEDGHLLHFLGRFHVIAVHLPVGIILLIPILEIASRFPSLKHLRGALPFVLWIGFFAGIAATALGFVLMGSEGTGGKAMELHLWTGLSVVLFTFLSLVFLLRQHTALYLLALAASVVTVSAAGHFGGAMVHETDYLAEHAPEKLKPLLLAGLGSNGDSDSAENSPAIGDSGPGGDGSPETGETGETGDGETAESTPPPPLAEQSAYTALVAPILEAKCNECHNENKIKGKLRLDTHELILAGAEGSDFPTVVPGDVEESELIFRSTLPEDDPDYMPPKGEGLSPEEIEILSLWIAKGATTELTVAGLGDDPGIEETAVAVLAGLAGEGDDDTALAEGSPATKSEWESLGEEEQQRRLGELAEAAERHQFSVMPLSAEDDRLRINVVNAARTFGDEQLALLEPVAERVAWLNVARSQVTDEGLKTVGRMRNLERLHLENTGVTSTGIAHLANLTSLEYLNLYGTGVDDGIFAVLERMPNLRKLYLWDTRVDPAAARAHEQRVNLEINTGTQLAEASESPAPEAKAPGKKAAGKNAADAPKEKKVQANNASPPKKEEKTPKKKEAPKNSPEKDAKPPKTKQTPVAKENKAPPAAAK